MRKRQVHNPALSIICIKLQKRKDPKAKANKYRSETIRINERLDYIPGTYFATGIPQNGIFSV